MTRLGRRWDWGIVGLLVVVVWLALPVVQAEAQKTVKYRISSYITKVDWIPVGDVKGHVVGVYARGGLASFENREVATYSTKGTFDYVKGNGSFQGYTTLTFEDGSTNVAKYKGTTLKAPDGKTSSFKGTGAYIVGSGRFEGIEGTLSFTGKRVMPLSKETKGDAYIDVTATYTLPSR